MGAEILVSPDGPERATRMLHSFIKDEERRQEAEEATFHLAKTEFARDELARELREVLEATFHERND